MSHGLKLLLAGIFATITLIVKWNDLGKFDLKFMWWVGQFAVGMAVIPFIFGE